MTRINSAIPVEHLTDEHLLAEHREIKRLPALFAKTDKATLHKRIPKEFCLGTGHVKFFFNKMSFIFNRYLALYHECKKRGFDIQYYGDNWFDSQKTLMPYWHGYSPTRKEKKLLIERIADRITESSKDCFHYYGKPITKQQAINLILYGEYP